MRVDNGVQGRESCEEARAALLLPDTESQGETTRARIEAHRGRCERCAQERDALFAVKQDVAASGVELDDLTRARMLSALAPRLDGLATRAGTARGRAKSPRSAALALAPLLAAAALALLVWPRARPAAPPRTASIGEQPAEARPVAIAEPPTASVLLPEAPAGAPADLLSGAISSLEVPAGARVRARLSRRARLTVVGPANVRVSAALSDLVELELAYGTLLGDYDHRQGGRLRIRTPHSQADVIGTLFAIEAGAASTRVSVAHGKVQVSDRAAHTKLLVEGGEAWSSGERAKGLVATSIADWMATHERDGAREPAATAPAPVRRAVVPRAPVDRTLAMTERARPPSAAVEPAHTLAPATPSGLSAPAEAGVAAPPPTPASAPTSPPTPPPIARPSAPWRPEPPRPPVSEAAPPAQDPAAAPESAESLYGRAERAMAAGDDQDARHWLRAVVAQHPQATLADTARYELLVRALARGQRKQAEQHADALVRDGRDRLLVQSAAFLRCRMRRDGGDLAGAWSCLSAFHRAHPGSPHDAEALLDLLTLAARLGDCRQALSYSDEYLRRHPDGAHATTARQVRSSCAR